MTNNQDIKETVILELSSRLKGYGFTKKRDTLSRETEKGLYQIIDIILGPSWGLKANHLGIAFGLTTEEWLNNLINWKRPKKLSSSDCEIRDCYCGIVPIRDECMWYPVSLGLPTLIRKTDSFIQEWILPYMEKLKTRKDIISLWRKHQSEIGLAKKRHFLAIGTLMYLNNDKNEGEKILSEVLADNRENTYFTSTIDLVLKGNSSIR